MFLDWGAQLGLLEHNIEANILRDFSLPVKKILVQQVVTFLLDGNNAVRTLISPAHVVWALETCGQGFTLPIDEEDSISKVIQLYRIWALEGKGKSPAPIEENFQFFIQRILEHYSLLFEPRASSKSDVEKHAKLCSQVLDILAMVGRQIGGRLSVETWEIFLKLLIAITDSVLRVDAQGSQEPLQRKLCSQLFKVLFELWLLSRTRNPELWDALKQRVAGWTQHMSLILTWKVTCFALTKRTAGILYGPAEGTDSVIIKIDESVQNIQLEDEYVFYSWHRMLNIIGNPNESINHPAIFLAFMNGVEILVNQYLKIGYSKSSSRFLSPDGSTILHIFGNWLFDAVHLDRNGFDEGTALAMKILCNIITTKHSTNFLPVYIASFYSSMQSALMKEGRVLLAAITSATNLFNYEIPGLRCLVPSFTYAIHKVITKRAKPFDQVMPAEHVRRACLSILGSLLCLPNHFATTKFYLRISDPAAKAFDVGCYGDLKPHFSMILSEALSNETYPPNLEVLLDLAYTWGIEDLENTSEFVKQAISLIVRKITTGSSGWPPEVALTALKILSSISSLYPRIERGFEQANIVVSNLCKYISGLLTAGQGLAMEGILVNSFKCMTEWILVDQWFLSYPDTKSALLSAVVLGLTGKVQQVEEPAKPAPAEPPTTGKDKKKAKKEAKKEEKKEKEQEKQIVSQPSISENVQESALNCLVSILNHTGNFPTACGPSSVSTLASEQEVLNDIISQSNGQVTLEDAKEYMRYYITKERSIICTIDRRFGEGGTCVIVRDRTGRYAWDSRLTYLPYVEKEPIEVQNFDIPIPVCTTPFVGGIGEVDAGSELGAVMGFLGTSETSSAFKIVESQVQREEAALQKAEYHLNKDISVALPKRMDPYTGECKYQVSRMLMSHLGYLSLENRNTIFPINMTTEFFQQLSILDQIPERECIKVGVLYIRRGQSAEDAFAQNQGGTLDYQEFIASLGWGINIAKHKGFSGGLSSTDTQVAPYYSTASTETIFIVSTLLSGDASTKRRAVTSSYAMIIWTECMEEYQPQAIWKRVRHNVVQIVINPLECGLYRVRVYSKNETVGVGPLFDGGIYSKEILGHLARETAIIAHKKESHDQKSPHQHREAWIEDMYQKHRKMSTLEQFYSGLFTSVQDQVGPFIPRAEPPQWVLAIGGPPTRSDKKSEVEDSQVTPPPSSSVENVVSLSTPPRDKSNGGFGARVTPTTKRAEAGNISGGSWLTMGGSRSGAGGKPAVGIGQRRNVSTEEEEDGSSKKKSRKKDKKSSSKVKGKSGKKDEDDAVSSP